MSLAFAWRARSFEGASALALVAALVLASDGIAGNRSNFLQLTNGVDFSYGGFYNPIFPQGTMGVWRCYPSELLHSPTRTVDPAGTVPAGTYATKITALHFTTLASGVTPPSWPTIVLSSSDGDCRLAPGGQLNFGFGSSTAALAAAPGTGWFGFGPLNSSSGTAHVLAAFTNVQAPQIWTYGPASAALSYALEIDQQLGSPSAIAVPEGESLTYWIAERMNQGPGSYQYWMASEDETSVCSSLSSLASAIGTPHGGVFRVPSNREFGMFIGTLDATLMAATSPRWSIGGSDITMGTTNPMDTGTGALDISISGLGTTTAQGHYATISFNSYDDAGSSFRAGKMVFANRAGFNSLGLPSCGAWSPGHQALPTGGPGGPVLSTAIPQQPRLVGRIDTLTAVLVANPTWIVSTTHATKSGGTEYPMFPGFAADGGSTGNTGGFAVRIPNDPLLVGEEFFFSGVNVDLVSGGLAVLANNGHSNQNGFLTRLRP